MCRRGVTNGILEGKGINKEGTQDKMEPPAFLRPFCFQTTSQPQQAGRD